MCWRNVGLQLSYAWLQTPLVLEFNTRTDLISDMLCRCGCIQQLLDMILTYGLTFHLDIAPVFSPWYCLTILTLGWTWLLSLGLSSSGAVGLGSGQWGPGLVALSLIYSLLKSWALSWATQSFWRKSLASMTRTNDFDYMEEKKLHDLQIIIFRELQLLLVPFYTKSQTQHCAGSTTSSHITLKRNTIQFTPFSLKEYDSPKNFHSLPSQFSSNFIGFSTENPVLLYKQTVTGKSEFVRCVSICYTLKYNIKSGVEYKVNSNYSLPRVCIYRKKHSGLLTNQVSSMFQARILYLLNKSALKH